MDVNVRFKQAADRAKSLPAQSNQTLLQLYGLYKQATMGDVAGPEPGALDFRAKAKYDAWSSLAGTPREDAMSRYIALVDGLAEDA